MKTLYIVRHAKSSWDYPNLPDHDRPLGKRGKRDAPEMGKRLKARNVQPDRVVSSTARRAKKTARKMTREIGLSKEAILLDSRLYDFGETGALNVIREQDDSVENLMIFGHNPGFTYLANDLGSLNIDNIPTSGMVALQFNISKWNEVAPGTGKLIFFDYPKKQFER